MGVIPKNEKMGNRGKDREKGPCRPGGNIINYVMPRLVRCREGRVTDHRGAHTFRNLAWESCKILGIILFIIIVVRLLFRSANNKEGVKRGFDKAQFVCETCKL